VGRDINRHHYTPDEIDADLQRPVVRALCGLIRLRNSHPAFGGQFHCEASADDRLVLVWRAGPSDPGAPEGVHEARLEVDLSRRLATLDCTQAGLPLRLRQALDAQAFQQG
jgi:sucrose phosphorylase